MPCEPTTPCDPGAALPSPPRRIVGNLGAAAIRDAARGRRPVPDPRAADLVRFAELGFVEVEDYVGWSVVEPERGVFDPGVPLAHLEAARRAGLAYRAFVWLHALPSWFRLEERGDAAPFRCLEHDRAAPYPSIFDPRTLEAWDRLLSHLARHLGHDVAGLTIGFPCDYGEVALPDGVGLWVLEDEPYRSHIHPGLWVGDRKARRRFGLGTPPAGPPADLLAFAAALRSAVTDWVRAAALSAREHFPAARVAFKIGHVGEALPTGQDRAALCRLARELGLEIWTTHAGLAPPHDDQVPALCRALGVPFVSEGLDEATAPQSAWRVFREATGGAAGVFEFFGEVERLHRLLVETRNRVGFAPRESRVGLLLRRTLLRREPRHALPPVFEAVAEPLADAIEYEPIDEDVLGPAALEGMRVLALPDPGPMEGRALEAVSRFVSEGGTLLLPCARAGEDVDPDERALVALLAGAERRASDLRVRFDVPAGGPEHVFVELGEPEGSWFLTGEERGVDHARPFFGRSGACRFVGGRFALRLPLDRASRWRLRLEVFCDPRARPERWRAEIDGEPIALSLPEGAGRIEASLPPRAGRDVTTWTFRGPTFVPAHSGENEDHRALGLVVGRLEAIREGADDVWPVRLRRRHLAPLPLDPRAVDQAAVPVARGRLLLVPRGDLPLLVAAAVGAAGAGGVPVPDGRVNDVFCALAGGGLFLLSRSAGPVRCALSLPGGGRLALRLPPDLPIRWPGKATPLSIKTS